MCLGLLLEKRRRLHASCQLLVLSHLSVLLQRCVQRREFWEHDALTPWRAPLVETKGRQRRTTNTRGSVAQTLCDPTGSVQPDTRIRRRKQTLTSQLRGRESPATASGDTIASRSSRFPHACSDSRLNSYVRKVLSGPISLAGLACIAVFGLIHPSLLIFSCSRVGKAGPNNHRTSTSLKLTGVEVPSRRTKTRKHVARKHHLRNFAKSLALCKVRESCT